MAANYFRLNSVEYLWLNNLNYIIIHIVIKLNAKTIIRLTWKKTVSVDNSQLFANILSVKLQLSLKPKHSTVQYQEMTY